MQLFAKCEQLDVKRVWCCQPTIPTLIPCSECMCGYCIGTVCLGVWGGGWWEEGGNSHFCTLGWRIWFLSSLLLKKGNMNFDHLFMKTGKSCASWSHGVWNSAPPTSWNSVLDPMQFRENGIFESKKGRHFRKHAAYSHPNFPQAILRGGIN